MTEARLHQWRDGAVAVLKLDHPGRRNALTIPLRIALADALDAIEADREARAILLTGEGGHFCAGADLTGMDLPDLVAGRERFRVNRRLAALLGKGSKPVVAAIEGWCVGAGLSLAMLCDTVVVSETARFAAGFAKVGLIPDLGLLHTLPARVGNGLARQIMLAGRTVDQAPALAAGLADEAGGIDVAMARARAYAESAPLPLALTRQWLAAGLDAALDWERDQQSALFLTRDHREGRDAFLDKRLPRFTGA